MKGISFLMVMLMAGSLVSFAQWNVNGTHISSNNTGNVGIGITSPISKFHIYSVGGVNSGLLTESTSATSYAGTDWKNSTGDLGQISLTGSSFVNGMVLSRQTSFNSNAPNGVSLVAYNATGFITFGTGGLLATNERMRINNLGNVGIGTSNPDAKLAVKGTIHAQEVKVDLLGAMAPDYVFEENYKLLSLQNLKEYIQQNKHLPEVPSAQEMEENGINLKMMNLLLLKKVEELTLHLIELEKQVNELKKGK